MELNKNTMKNQITTTVLIALAFILGRCSKTCTECVECVICDPCSTREEIRKEVIIKDLQNEIKNITISDNRRIRDSIWARHRKD